ncbi:LamG domain-containing protein [Conexibacter stalactiti]|uniref:LamG domain-containing protein n=1 Tax=Conexibacter stalactiti TaxID=1940611 RepID=A0ABU4HVW2_9ACTN|nr:LamG domain-containing protein [Conexibacter stalactiti]MDW5597360.1 LamG domain-containing protein [Conexibacter stalactiti]MEC5038002.1 LamG domain-containing protein [Conexibacter stalactiti]
MPRRRSRRLAVLLALSVAGIVALVQAAAAQAAAPLAAQWPLDAAATAGGFDTTDDLSGNGLALRGPAGTVRVGSAQGKFGGYLSSANTTTLQVTSPLLAPAQLTLLAWIKQNGEPGVLRYIAGRGDDGPTCLGSSYALYTGYPGRAGLRFYVRQPGPTAESVLSDAPPSAAVFDNRWHLVAGTFDGTYMHFYVDGVEVGSPKPATGISYAPPIIASNFYVDGYSPSAGCLGASDFPGAIDELRVYDRALTPTELGRLAAAPGPDAPALVPDGGTGGPPPTSPSPPPGAPGPPSPPPDGPGRATVIFGRAVGSQRPGTTVLDASGTSGATQLDWDLSGDRRADVSCPASQPFLGVSVQRSTTANVGLSALGGARIAATGGTGGSFISSRIFLRGIDPSSALLRVAPRVAPPDVAVCARTFGALTAAPMKFCEQQTVIWGLMSAQGCFIREEDEGEVPAGERALVRSHYESAKVSAVVVAICNQAARGLKPQSLCDEARAFFRVMPYDVYVAKGTVDLNGIKIAPRSGSAVVVFPRLNRLVASNAKVTWGGTTVRTGQLDLNFKNDESVTRIHFTGGGSKDCACGRSFSIARFDGRRGLPDIGGFKLDGSIDLALEGIDGRRYSSGIVQLRLPPEFAIFGGNPPSASVRVLAQNGTGLQTDNLDISVPEAAIGPVRLTDVRFRYAARGHIDGNTDPNSTCDRDEWKAQARVYLTGGGGDAGFNFAPPPAQNGIGFCDGAFHHFGGALRFGGPIPRPQIFPGVFLDELSFAMQLRPLLIRAGGKLSVADISRVTGTLLMVFATPQQPYTLTPSDAGPELRLLAGRRFDSTTIAGGGAVDLKFPGIGYLPVASAAVMYSYPDHIYAGGEVRIVGPGIAIYGHAAIEALLNRGLFTSAIGGKACLAGVKKGLCFGGDGWVTSKGMVACLNLFDTLHPGAGIVWATRRVTIWPFDGCKPSRYWVTFDRRAVARAAAAGDLSFTVERGETIKNVRLPGDGAAPQVRVTTPNGETLDVSGDDWASSAHMRGVRDEKEHVTYIGVSGKTPGRYTVTPLPGSAPVRTLEATRAGYDTHFAARVAAAPGPAERSATSAARAVRAGSRQVLTYDARKRGGGQRVTFVERGDNLMNPLGTVTGGRGRIVYTPAPGRPERREIVAMATVDGTPIADQTLDSYQFGGTPRIGAPRAVRVVRRGTRLTVRWTPVPGARGYGVVLRYGVGRERQLTAVAGKRSLTIARVPLTEDGVVRVSARDALDRWGKPRTSNRFRATKPLPTLLQTDRSNEKRKR